MPTFRGPIHHAMATSRPMWSKSPIWPTHQRPNGFQTYNTGSQPSMFSTFPPQPPLHPPPPPPGCPTTPHRFCTTTPKSPSGLWPPQTTSPVSCGYTIRPCEIPPVDTWKPDPEFHDTSKVNGLDFPATVRSSKFTHYKDIESMEPLQVPLWKFLRQGLHNKWLRRIAHGRETYVIPFDHIGTNYGIRCRARQPTLETSTLIALQLTDHETREPTSTEGSHSADGEGHSPTHSILASHYTGN